jgi:hypothetical protein
MTVGQDMPPLSKKIGNQKSSLSHDKIKGDLVSFFQKSCIIEKIIVNNINNRVQDFPDPVTSTLILMASSPMQIMFCENGILLFKTSNLPVLPYTSLNRSEREFLRNILEHVDNAWLTETYYGCGKFAVQVNVGSGNYMPKKGLLLAFVDVMQKQKDFKEICVLQRLSDIILQRFLSNISVHSDDISLVMEKIWGSSQKMHIV